MSADQQSAQSTRQIGTKAYFYKRRIATFGVPCDDAAIRRGADALRHAPPGTPEEHARLVLRAAGETP